MGRSTRGKQLDYSDLVGDVEGVVVGGKADVGLLGSVGSDQGVDLGHVDVVELLDGRLHLMLVSLKNEQDNKFKYFNTMICEELYLI